MVAVVYVAGAVFFMNRFLPNTVMGEHDISLMEAADAERVLVDSLGDYEVDVSGQGFALNLTAEEAGMDMDAPRVVKSMLSDTNPWLWPLEVTRSHNMQDRLAASYSEGSLGRTVRAAVEKFNKTAKPPVDATVAFDKAKGTFTAQKESAGTALDAEAVMTAVGEALATMEPKVRLTASHLQQPTLRSTDGYLDAAVDAANQLIEADVKLTMGGAVAAEVDPELLSTFVSFDENLVPSFDDAALTAWVDEAAASCTTAGSERSFTRPDGKAVTVAGGTYGWTVDRDALLDVVRRSVDEGVVGEVEMPCTTTGAAFNGTGAQDWGARYCDIDLTEQHVRFYDESGALAWEAPCVTGTPNGSHDTPTGVYWLNRKQSPSKLEGTNLDGSKYVSTVRYWMPFVGNVIGLHDAYWQPAFGGSLYRNGAGSHGCVNLPVASAESLYGIIQEGDVVVCHW
ncbi:hypothetical protein B5F40_10480 [Gordonibacter sp. An230]|uniref:L,D-transpeptidase family protein n=1 Tax=Gordonibacter sp. An230 TaxID=1965592 RepID=UPI000B3830D8|nr:L,D-transpeptidase family protein [Gordonibacter sp. An230]OUO89526.1 hypothetical protein B5F40_10480 [Gordonibacter sp. An230]